MEYFAFIAVLLLSCQLCLSSPLPLPTEVEDMGKEVQGRTFGFLKGFALGYKKEDSNQGGYGASGSQGNYGSSAYQGGYGSSGYQGSFGSSGYQSGYGGNQYQSVYVNANSGSPGGYNGFSSGYAVPVAPVVVPIAGAAQNNGGQYGGVGQFIGGINWGSAY